MYSYTAYGLGISSEIPLPGLPSDDDSTSGDIHVRRASVELPADADTTGDHCVYATSTEAYYAIEGVGIVHVERGRTVSVDPAPDASPARLQFIILGTALGMLLYQRGSLVLHACAVTIGNRVIAFLGGTGAGKSTLGAAFHAHGHGVVADDVVAIPDPSDPLVPPGPLLLKLDGARMHAETGSEGEENCIVPGSSLQPVTGSVESKRFYRVERSSDRPHPLTHVFVLDRAETPAIEPIAGRERLLALVRHSYARRRLAVTGGLSTNLAQCGTLAESVSVTRLFVPESYAALSDVVQRVEAAVVGGDAERLTRHDDARRPDRC